jgi:hypothetical protein
MAFCHFFYPETSDPSQCDNTDRGLTTTELNGVHIMATNNLSDYPRELEINTADLWLDQGTIWITETGCENTYYVDQFGTEFYCKNYPSDYGPVKLPKVKLPKWISQDLSPSDIAAILQSDCSSGAYMPAVGYYSASQTMAEFGDDVLQYLEDVTGELPTPPHDISWSGLAVFYLSKAVELFCACHEHLADWENEEPIGGAT